MKKLFYASATLALSILLSSCDDGSELRTYQIQNNCSNLSYADRYLDGSIYEVEVYFFKSNDKVLEIHEYDMVAVGTTTDIIEAPKGSKKAKISFRFVPMESLNYHIKENDRVYSVNYTELEKGKNTVIEIKDETQINSSLVNPNEEIILMNNDNFIFIENAKSVEHKLKSFTKEIK